MIRLLLLLGLLLAAWPVEAQLTGTQSVTIRGVPHVIIDSATIDAITSITNPVAVTGTFWQATQPVSGTVTAQQATAASLRMAGGDAAGSPTAGTVLAVQGIASGTALPVSGTFWQGTQPVSGTFWQTTQPVSGTFWQTTQPISHANLDVALSTRLKPADTLTGVTTVTNLSQMSGAAISMNTGARDAGTQRVTVATNDSVPVTGTFWQTTQPVSGTVTANPATSAGKTLTYVSVNQGAAGTTALAGASVGNKHKVIGVILTMSLLGTLKFTDGVADLTGPMDVAATGGFVVPTSILPMTETGATDRALNLVTTLGAARGVVVILTEP